MQTSLSELLQSLRTAHVESAFVELGAAAGARLSAGRGAFLHLLLAGKVEISCPGKSEAICLADPGDYVLLLDPSPHVLRTAGCETPRTSDYFRSQHGHDSPPTIRFGTGRQTARTISGTFRFDSSSPLVRALPRIIPMIQSEMVAGQAPLLQPLANGALGGPGATMMVTALFDLLVLHAVRTIGMPMFASGGPRITGPLRIPLALTLIHSNLRHDWSVGSLADEVGTSRSNFAAEFLEHVGQPPMAYIAMQRMILAARLLRTQSLSVAEVAWRAGYVSVSSFSRIFKRHQGSPPGVYQSHHANRNKPDEGWQLHWAAFLGDNQP